MPAGRRIENEFERARHRRVRSSDLDPAALDAAVETLVATWPWLAEQYRQHVGEEVDLPREPLAAAIRRYLAHAGLA